MYYIHSTSSVYLRFFLLHINTNPSSANTNIHTQHCSSPNGRIVLDPLQDPAHLFFQSAMGVATSVTQAEWRQVGTRTMWNVAEGLICQQFFSVSNVSCVILFAFYLMKWRLKCQPSGAIKRHLSLGNDFEKVRFSGGSFRYDGMARVCPFVQCMRLELFSFRGGTLEHSIRIAKHLQFEGFQFLLFSKMFQKVWAFRCPMTGCLKPGCHTSGGLGSAAWYLGPSKGQGWAWKSSQTRHPGSIEQPQQPHPSDTTTSIHHVLWWCLWDGHNDSGQPSANFCDFKGPQEIIERLPGW